MYKSKQTFWIDLILQSSIKIHNLWGYQHYLVEFIIYRLELIKIKYITNKGFIITEHQIPFFTKHICVKFYVGVNILHNILF